MIVVDLSYVADAERRQRIEAEIALVKEQAARAVAGFKLRQAIETARAELATESRERAAKRRREFLARTGWFGFGGLLGFVLALLALGAKP